MSSRKSNPTQAHIQDTPASTQASEGGAAGNGQHISARLVTQTGDAPMTRGRPGERALAGKTSQRRVKSRQSHGKEEERSDRQRKEEQYQKWQSFKMKQRSDRHVILQKKLSLQQELIHAQDRRHDQRQVEEERRRAEIRDVECQLRRQRQEVLTQLGKADLANERREARTKRRAAKPVSTQPVSANPQQDALDGKAAMERKNPGRSPSIGGPAYRRLSMVYSSHEQEDGSGRFSEGEEEEQEVESEVEGDGLKSENLVFHQSLQKLLGHKQATYFLRPKFDPESQKDVRVPRSLTKQGGHAGVNALWGTLRDHSTVKLQKADAKIPQELKAAYGAFVRECLTDNKTVAKRSFYSEDGIPDGEKLQDGSYHQRVKETQKQVELMYRAAQTNEDKTTVLLFNNPLPDYNNLKGTEGPLRYHPSWSLQDDDSEVIEADYKKWLHEVPSPWSQELLPSLDDDTYPTAPTRPNQAGDSVDSEDSMSWVSLPDLPAAAADDHRLPQTIRVDKKLSFLTEEAARCPGQFRKRWEQKRDGGRRCGQEFEASIGEGHKMDTKTAPSTRRQTRSLTAPSSSLSGDRVQKVPQTARNDWQPLSLAALEDYKPTVHLLGPSDFAHGQEFMWKPIVAAESGRQ